MRADNSKDSNSSQDSFEIGTNSVLEHVQLCFKASWMGFLIQEKSLILLVEYVDVKRNQ